MKVKQSSVMSFCTGNPCHSKFSFPARICCGVNQRQLPVKFFRTLPAQADSFIKCAISLIALVFIVANSIGTVEAQENDVIAFRVLSDTHNFLFIEVDYYYTGGFGPAWLSVTPTLHGSDTKIFNYQGCQPSENNAIIAGRHKKCIGMTIAGGRQLNPYSTDGIEICLFSGISTAKYCESFNYNKQWSSAP